MLSTLDRNLERWALLIFYMMLVTTMAIEVIRREIFAYSSVWGEEIVRYAFIYLAWIGAAAAVRERAHIRIDVLMHYVGPRTKAALYIFGDLVMGDGSGLGQVRIGQRGSARVDGLVPAGGAGGLWPDAAPAGPVFPARSARAS